MAEFNTFPVLSSLQGTDEILVVRDGVGYQAKVSDIPGQNAVIKWASFQIRMPSGQSGGDFSPSEQWILRPFNYANPLNEFGSITLSPHAGALELPPGRYQFSGWFTGMENQAMRARLRALAVVSTPIYSASTWSKHYSWHIPLDGLIAINTATQFAVEMWCDRNRAKRWGFGYRTNIEPEIYGSIVFTRKQL